MTFHLRQKKQHLSGAAKNSSKIYLKGLVKIKKKAYVCQSHTHTKYVQNTFEETYKKDNGGCFGGGKRPRAVGVRLTFPCMPFILFKIF